ncbi:MAG: winged helix-turn-helix domain-containing protein [Acidobacteria bacterium]|nr:winged helix-turn-helix domain-containing protein [Acidobacteriota bacterium]
MSKERNELYEFAGFRLDVREHTLEHADSRESIQLPEKAFQTLCVLVQNSGRLMSKQALLDAVWPDSFVEENNLDKAVHAIRNALGERSAGEKYIETVRKHGYRFVAEVRSVAPANGMIPSSAKPPLTESGQHAVVSLADWQKLTERLVPGAEPPAADEELVKSQTAEPKAEAASERLPGRRRPAYFYVGAAGILAGSVALGGWYAADNWMRAANPADTSNAERSAETAAVNRARSPAYDLYVRGKVKVSSENREDTEAAISLLEEAVRLDPDLAEAYAQLARGYNTLSFKYSGEADRKRFHENAEVAIEKALALNPDLAEAHFARGLILWSNTEGFPHAQVIRSYKRSAQLEPNWDEPYHQLSLVYSHIGLMDEARQSVQKALEINPNNTLARFRVGVYMQYAGRFEDALAAFKTIPRDETPLLMDRSLAETLIQLGRASEADMIADDYLRRFPQDEGGGFAGVKALLLAKAGRNDEAEAMIRRANEIGRGYGHFHHTAYNIASAYAAMGRPDEAVQWLENSADSGFPNYPYFELDPNLQSLKAHPGFVRLMSKLKRQWEQFKAEA